MRVRRLAALSGINVWAYGGIDGVDLRIVSEEIPGADGSLIGIYNEHASVDAIAEDFIHYATSRGVILSRG